MLERISTAELIIYAIGSEPGVKQSDLPDRFGLEKELVREIMWVMWWARIVRREKDGRSHRLCLA